MRYRHTVPDILNPVRVADYCAHAFSLLGTKSAAKKAISAGRIFLNDRLAKTSDWVKSGDHVELRGGGIKKIKKLDLALPIIHQDEYLVVVNKPGGIAVNGNRYKTVENALSNLNQCNSMADALLRPVAAHRLDVPTSGLVILAKTKSALVKLNRAFQEQRISKTYQAVVHGKPQPQGEINMPVDGKYACTRFETVRSVRSRKFGFLTLLHLFPITGRRHQLRLHLRSIGHLIVGDKMYADGQKTILGKGLLLCASSLQFSHPISKEEINMTIQPPQKFTRILDREADRFKSGR